MSTKWTVNQQKAIDIRNTNTLVSAAAGSGKTAVLVERVIQLITDENNPVYVNNLLVATFTNAAAAEMRERIHNALQDRINQNPENSFLREQLVLLGQAQITTVHSFCINLLRENFHLLGIRHDFDIADDIKLNSLKTSAMETVLEQYYARKDKDFLKLVDAFGGKKSDDNLVNMIYQLSEFSQSMAYPEKWLNDCSNDNIDIDKYRYYINKSIKGMLNDIKHRYLTSLEYIESDEGLEPYCSIYSDELDFFESLIENFDNTTASSMLFNNFSFERLPRKKKEAMEETSQFVKKTREFAKKNFDAIKDLYLCSDEEILNDFKLMNEFTKPLCMITGDFLKEYSRLKIENNMMSFSDLEHYAIDLLDNNEGLRNEIKSKYFEIFVDEYQDTNAVQAQLFELLSNGNNLFMVGDVKQSIYSFRNTNPEFFIGKYNEFDFKGNTLGTKILLSQNFRSSNGVLSFVNHVFEKIMSDNVGGVNYNEEHLLRYGNESIKDLDISSEVHIIDSNTADLNEDARMTDKIHLEAMYVADSIINLVENEKPEIYDKYINGYRPVTYKDIAILMRKTKGVASVYADVFAQRGIPVFTEGTGGYFNNIEIATVMSFLKVIENPLQDIPVLAVMRSPIYSFDDNTIAQIRAENKYESFYMLLKKSKNPKAKAFVSDIERLSDFAKYNSVEYIVRKIVYDTGYYHFVGGLPDGERRMINLRLLCERAGTFCKNGYVNILKFVRYVEDMIVAGKEYSSAKIISENDNVVTVMTIHKSKGLEFPVVYLSGCGGNFNKRDLKMPYIFDNKLGIAMDIIDTERHLKYVPYVKKAIAEKKDKELVSEEVRLLYVALTRAKYKVIITGTVDKAYKKFMEFNQKPCMEYTFNNETSYIQWIMNVAIKDSVFIHTAQEVLETDNDLYTQYVDKTDFGPDYSEFYDEIDNRLNFKYPYMSSKNIPSKKSISEILDLTDDSVHLNSIKSADNTLTSAQKGTVVHFVLQNLNLSKVDSVININNQIDKMIEMKMLETEYKELIDTEAIYNFFISDIGKRMLKSSKVYREFKFCVEVPSEELGYVNTDEKILVQGVIDCCFEEDGSYVIIDYKTGSLQDKYQKQLQMYKRCLEIATGKMVKETKIYPLI